MHLVQMIVIDLLVGLVVVGGLAVFLERTILKEVLADPVRSHLVSLLAAWFTASALVMLITPWRSDVVLLYAIGAIPVAIVQLRRGQAERARIGYRRKQAGSPKTD